MSTVILCCLLCKCVLVRGTGQNRVTDASCICGNGAGLDIRNIATGPRRKLCKSVFFLFFFLFFKKKITESKKRFFQFIIAISSDFEACLADACLFYLGDILF